MPVEDILEAMGAHGPGEEVRAVTGYVGPDLFFATTLEQEELDKWYQSPAPSFRAGLGFQAREAWLELVGQNEVLQRWVNDGYSEYVQQIVPEMRRANNPNTAGEVEFVQGEVEGLLECGAVVDVTDAHPREKRVIAALTVAMNREGKRRLCWNGRPLSAYMPYQKFKMEHVHVAAALMRPGDFMFTIDMKSGYHQLPVKPWFRRLLCFEWGGRVYQWQVLPFGLSPAPRAYSKVTRVLVKRWRQLGIRCSNYIDDFIFFAPSLEEALRIRAVVLGDLTRVGWFISPKKSMLRPGTAVTYLGMVLCSLPVPHVRVPREKVQLLKQSMRQIVRRALVGPVVVKGKTLASVLGFLQSFRVAVPVVSLFTRELYAALNTLPCTEEGYSIYGAAVTLSSQAVAECQFWYRHIGEWNGFVLPPRAVSRVLYTDASGSGFGGLVHRVLHRQMEPAVALQAGVWELGTSVDSVYTELKGLWRALVAAGGELKSQVVLHRTDSISTYRVLSKGGSQRSPRLTDIVRKVFLYCVLHNITMSSDYVGSGVIIKSGADLLSRGSDASDCRLHPHLYAALWHLAGRFEVDRFATALNVQGDLGTGAPLPYWAMCADGRAVGVDALTADWRGVHNYAFPPVALVGKVLLLVREQKASAVIVVPEWPSQWWWPLALEMAALRVDLQRLAVGPVLVAAKEGAPDHPFGPNFPNPYQVRWNALVIKGGV
jgi:hypothetical protein